MTSAAAARRTIPVAGSAHAHHDWRTLRLTSIAVATAAALIAALLAASIALGPVSPDPDDWRQLQPAPGLDAAAPQGQIA